MLVGDPKQLPPTVLSREAARAKLAQSLFERLQRAPVPCAVLQAQYRMHPDISAFPARYFYAEDLKDGVTGAQKAAVHHAEVRAKLLLSLQWFCACERPAKVSACCFMMNMRLSVMSKLVTSTMCAPP